MPYWKSEALGRCWMKIDCVKLQREIRDRAYQANKDKSLREEVLAIQQSIKQKGYGHLFQNRSEESEKAESKSRLNP